MLLNLFKLNSTLFASSTDFNYLPVWFDNNAAISRFIDCGGPVRDSNVRWWSASLTIVIGVNETVY